MDTQISDYILVCPYCMSRKTGEEIGCCGESRDHFEEVPVNEEGDILD